MLLLKNRKGLIGIITLASIIMLSIAADILAPYHYNDQDISRRLQPPSSKHLFGTDGLGRDVFSRVIYGSRITLLLSLTISVCTTTIGVLLGLISGYMGGLSDIIIGKITEAIWSFPTIVIALALAATLGPGLLNLILVLALLMWIPFARVTRAKTMVLREMAFIKYIKALGMNSLSVMFKHLLPNLFPDIIVLFVLTVPDAMRVSAALSFIGLGLQPPTPEWGVIMSEGWRYLFIAPWIIAFPGAFLVLTVLSLNLLGDVLTDLLNPRTRVE
ncbi:MAG: ABC transporter permease [Desulfurococcaceae archaeon]